ncbi:hypothetical protein [Mycolicibacterium gadium]|jgi:hypothetical protein|uniref:hypothetical protein n=1 Tax=Mycolicibacterium gadium TaxID=1794 RepID=UPI000AF1515F
MDHLLLTTALVWPINMGAMTFCAASSTRRSFEAADDLACWRAEIQTKVDVRVAAQTRPHLGSEPAGLTIKAPGAEVGSSRILRSFFSNCSPTPMEAAA